MRTLKVFLVVTIVALAGVSAAGQIDLSDWLGSLGFAIDPDFVLSDVSQQQATAMAEYYVYENPPPAIEAAVAAGAQLVLPPRGFPSDAVAAAWVFDLTGPGFVVTTSHTDFEPLLVYSTESEFPWEPHSENALRQVLLLDLALRLLARAVSLGGCEVPLHWDLWDLALEPRLGPMLASLAAVTNGPSTYSGPDPIIAFPNDWHQDSPCNSQCDQARNLTGCVPLAMVQIICHHKHPPLGSVSAPTRYAYPQDPDCGDAVVQWLCSKAGATVGIDYGPRRKGDEGASVEMAAYQLRTTWGYTSPGAQFYKGEAIGATSYELLCKDLVAGRPAILNLKGFDETKSTIQTAFTQHAVVCDGYKVEQQHGQELTRAFHLRMGNDDAGVNVWYSLPTDCFPPDFHVLMDGVLQIGYPGMPPRGSCALTLELNEEDNQYNALQWVQVKVDAGGGASAILYTFSALIPDLWTSVTWNFEAGEDRKFPLPWFTLTPGVETIVLWADMGGCVRVLPRTYVIGPNTDPLDDLQLDGSYSSWSNTVDVSYSVRPTDCQIHRVTAYLISPSKGLESVGTSSGRTGSFRNISLEGTGSGEHVVVVVASTSAGALSQTYSFDVQ